jgi:hypothetical protein
VEDPTSLLQPPEAADQNLTNGLGSPLDVFNYVSPAAWINNGIAELTGFDFIGWATSFLAGDWEAISEFGDAMTHLAAFMQQLGMNIQKGILKLDGSWQGNANDAAFLYFSRLAAATSGQQTALHASAHGYQQAAAGAYQLASQLGNILQALVDKALIAILAAGAGTATAETGAGALVGYGVAALMVRDMITLINNASTIANTAGTVIVGAFGAGTDILSQGRRLSAVSLPSAAYSPPSA